MDGSGTVEYADSSEAGAESTKAEFELAPADSSREVLREAIGRNVMTWIGAGMVQHCEAESGRDRRVKAQFH